MNLLHNQGLIQLIKLTFTYLLLALVRPGILNPSLRFHKLFGVPFIKWETFCEVRRARLYSQLLVVKQQWSHVSFGTWWYLCKRGKYRPAWRLDLFLKAKRTCFIKRISPNKERGWLVLVLWELFNSMRKFEDPLWTSASRGGAVVKPLDPHPRQPARHYESRHCASQHCACSLLIINLLVD